MKKILITLILILIPINSFAIEEIKLEKESLNLEYLSNVYYGKIEESKEVSPILKLFSKKGLEFKDAPIDAIKLTFLFDGQLQYNNTAHYSPYFKHDFATVEPMISFFFNDRRTEATFDINLLRDLDGYSNSFTEKISRAFISHKITDNQKIIIGQGSRLPVSYNGSRGTMEQEFILKSQLGRTFGEARSVGIRNAANYKYLDYDIGLYDSTRYMKEFGHGLDFTSYFMLKPLANREDDFKNLKIGTGHSVGDYKTSYYVYSVFMGLDYKKIHFKTEYSNADGYNGIKNSNKEADGIYTSVVYDITPKLSLLGRYDYFTADKTVSRDYCQEYTLGATYKIFKNMKFMLNFANRNYSNKPDSNMILFATRFII
ncbi:MAG: hypothetical protein IJY61_05025 [Candidatus Gastranaerophilales bacterium]|nr:hypothetical protein [Candidatus Gastranaerophilales bacterium]